jgi:UPF0288 family protein (methanogenesis marker protein 3)
MKKSDILVAKLLETEPFNVREYFLAGVDQKNQKKEQETLKRFKQGVRAYIKWLNPPEEGFGGVSSEDLVDLRKAKTFEEVQAVLVQWEGEPTFMEMVQRGYFV